MLHRWSEKIFFNVENEFSHIAVEAPSVSLCLKAVTTDGIAIKVLPNFVKMFATVHVSLGKAFLSDRVFAINELRSCQV